MYKLPLWVVPNSKPGFYDTESATAIEQTAKLYRAMQDLIDEYNSFSTNVNIKIEEFMNGTKKDYEVFTTELRQEFQDFIDVIELKIKEQDGVISEQIEKMDNNYYSFTQSINTRINNQNKVISDAVKYMKDNIANSLQGVIEDMRDSGELGEIIMLALDEFTQRLNELETSFTQKLTDLETSLTNKMSQDKEEVQARIEEVNETLSNQMTEDKKELTDDISFTDSKIDYVTPQMFGAVGDGVADDTEAIEQAIRSGNTIHFLPGKYLITKPLVLTNQNLVGFSAALQNPTFPYDWENDLQHNVILNFALPEEYQNEYAITFKSHQNCLHHIIVHNQNQMCNKGVLIDGDFPDVSHLYVINFLTECVTFSGGSYYGTIHGLVIKNSIDAGVYGLKLLSYADSGSNSTAHHFTNVMIEGKFEKNLHIAGVQHTFDHLHTRNFDGGWKLYLDNCRNIEINKLYMEQDGSVLEENFLYMDSTAYSCRIDNIYLSCKHGGSWINNGFNCKYSFADLGTDFSGIPRIDFSKNYWEGFYVDASGNINNYDPTSFRSWNDLIGNIEMNGNDIILTNNSSTKSHVINISYPKTELAGRTICFMFEYESETDVDIYGRCLNKFSRCVGKKGWASVIQQMSTELTNNNFTFQIGPSLSDGQSVTIRNIGIYIVNDIGGYKEPTLSKTGGNMYGDIKYMNGNPIIKDSEDGTFYKITVASGQLSLVQL